MKTIIFLLLVALAAAYIRGSVKIIKSQNANCQWHLVYAFCEGTQPTPPSFMDAIKAGIKF
jgi:hypothetical protein